MKKLLTVVLAVAMILQSSFLVLAAEQMDVDANLQVKASEADGTEYGDSASIIKDGSVDMKAEIDMSSVKTTFESKRQQAYDIIGEEYKERLDSTPVTGDFVLTLKYPNSEYIELPSAVTNGSGMAGFDDAAKAAFKETGRSVKTVGAYSYLEISVSVANDVNVGNLPEKLQDMYFTADDVTIKKAGSYSFVGSMTGNIIISYGSQYQEMDFTAKKDGSADIGVAVEVTNPVRSVTVTVANAAADATVTLNGTTAQVVDGVTVFTGIPEGIYNVVVVSNGKTVTTDVTVNGDTEVDVEIPVDNFLNSKVENTSSSNVVVKEMKDTVDEVAQNSDVSAAVDDGKDVSLDIKISDASVDSMNAINNKIDEDTEIEVEEENINYIDVVTGVNADETAVNVEEGTVVLAISYNAIADGGVKVYSISADETEAKELKESSAGTAGTYNKDDEYVYITVPVGHEGTYAVVVYTEAGVTPPPTPTPTPSETVTVNRPSGGLYIPSSSESVTWKNPFLDVSESDWFYDVVKEANINGLMNGVASNYFDPNADITRGMFVTVIYRMEGSPITGVLDFVDVPSYEYYAAAIAWAHKCDIVKGVSETEFAPDDIITREQMAAILYRYMQYNNLDVSAGENTSISYSDNDLISEYAVTAVKWALGAGVMVGNGDGTYAPVSNATRAEAAAVFVRTLNHIKEMAK